MRPIADSIPTFDELSSQPFKWFASRVLFYAWVAVAAASLFFVGSGVYVLWDRNTAADPGLEPARADPVSAPKPEKRTLPSGGGKQPKIDLIAGSGSKSLAVVGVDVGALTPAQIDSLKMLAYQGAVARLCHGYELDYSKFAQGIAEATSKPIAGVSIDGTARWDSALQNAFGVVEPSTNVAITYASIGEERFNMKGFCASADELKSSGVAPNYWK